ncbi:helix-turn-helix transcriptional regulator [Acerihabitans arboris]|uniref:DNA-binding protein n=1 Tax=Acerihabitans arboris TaxID=2691583 RepID=A0A845SJN2_9GAMM|nr:DNA-binding protein [Acerihabitans arboris]NDL65130.1 DNA-binding protein [Acerihabitans arboris]
MALYNFALTLSGVTADTKGLEDRLFESGCDDALVCFYGKSVYLEFDRDSESFAQAALSAIGDIESAELGAKVVSVDADLVGLSDIAELSDMSRQAVAMLKDGTRGSGDFPSPVQRIKGVSPLWRWADVAEWLAATGRLHPDIAVNARQLDIINMALQLRESQQRNQIADYLNILEAS